MAKDFACIPFIFETWLPPLLLLAAGCSIAFSYGFSMYIHVNVVTI